MANDLKLIKDERLTFRINGRIKRELVEICKQRGETVSEVLNRIVMVKLKTHGITITISKTLE